MSEAVQGLYLSQDESGFPIWVAPDGYSVRAISGGDGSDGGTDDSSQGTGETEEIEEDDFGLSGDFLAGIENEEHRQLLEPYVKKWDAGVTRRFQDLHSKLEPYEQYGDPDTIAQYVELVNYINSSPQEFYEQLGTALGISTQQAQQLAEQQQTPPVVPGVPSQQQQIPAELERLVSPFQEKLSQQEKLLEVVGQYILQQQEDAVAAQEDIELDNYLSQLHDEFGEFDEDFVLTKMLSGMDGAQAINAWQNSLQTYINNGSKKPPMPVLGGGGSVPAENKDITQMERGDVKSLVAGLIQQAANDR